MQIYQEAYSEHDFLIVKTYGSQYFVKIFVIPYIDTGQYANFNGIFVKKHGETPVGGGIRYLVFCCFELINIAIDAVYFIQ